LVLGLRRLGWEMLFLDRIAPEMCFDYIGPPAPLEDSLCLLNVMGYLDDEEI
jgi:hypothetical protein